MNPGHFLLPLLAALAFAFANSSHALATIQSSGTAAIVINQTTN
ncbi:MAG: hypothetical protein OEW58_05740 [Gammaproteobacteria bacterium]|nr:hypothetical protein [Gammaproteobacteria bacterium]